MTKGSVLKRPRFHARGKIGRNFHRFAHLNVELREIDFDAKAEKAGTEGERKRWRRLKQEADVEKGRKEEEEEEIERLRKIVEEGN